MTLHGARMNKIQQAPCAGGRRHEECLFVLRFWSVFNVLGHEEHIFVL